MTIRRNRLHAIILTLALGAMPLVTLAQYAATRTGDTVQLKDGSHNVIVSVAPSAGDIVFDMKVKGESILRFPFDSVEAYKSRGGVAGIPFLGPWANRLDEQGFYANGKKYNFNMTLGNVRGAIPIHGFLTNSPFWEVVELKADKHSAWVTARLDFYKHPEFMAQFPFAHTIEITHRLQDGALEVHTRIVNLSTDPMPVAIGFHPYFKLTDSKREDWTVQIGARSQYTLQPNKIPSGDTVPIAAKFPDPQAIALKKYDLDDVFGDLVRDARGRALMTVTGKHQKLTVEFGPHYLASVVYSPDPTIVPPPRPAAAGAPAQPPRAPQDPNFICFEPMAGITDAMNLNHAGKYAALQSISPGGTWEESFWVIPSGF